VRVPSLEQSNTAVFFGNRLFLKGYRRMREGVNPELELGRFLTEASPFPHIAPVLGAVEYVEGGSEPVTAEDLEQWKRSIAAEMDATFRELDAARAKLPAEAAARAATLLERREALERRVRGTRVELDGLVKTRYHGDLHLGQVLVVQDDFTIVDFEGEPERPVAERRAKHCVLRDVAGMLRSFSYAAHAARLRRAAGEPATEAGAQALADWEAGAAHHFMQGYGKAAEGLASLPANAEALEGLLELFVVEKALYELRYESANRPDWIEIPLAGLLEIAQQ